MNDSEKSCVDLINEKNDLQLEIRLKDKMIDRLLNQAADLRLALKGYYSGSL